MGYVDWMFLVDIRFAIPAGRAQLSLLRDIKFLLSGPRYQIRPDSKVAIWKTKIDVTLPKCYESSLFTYRFDFLAGRISKEMSYQLIEYPANQSMWIPAPSTTKCRFMEFFYVMLYHAIPGVIFDIYLKIIKNPRR